ncbi:hypothetical protein RclHR1_12930004 [Rhizophagus clarus]|nr:hypothetical protein RclHR1_12930004 [Rhizophagus clarus]
MEIKPIKFASLNRLTNNTTLLNKQINGQDSTIVVRAKEIEASELHDPPKHVAPRQGSRAPCYLRKIERLPIYIKFHGLSEIYREKVMVFEWAELGTLKDVYRNFKIDWEAKISLARDICRGLAFLQSVKILHHDIRCENVLINENIQPKLCNFRYAREFNADETKIHDINAIIHWLAPEQLRHIQTEQDKKSNKMEEARYTIQCEIFSFWMLLWELTFQKIPYENMCTGNTKSCFKSTKSIITSGNSAFL